jgi:hypothetical protein
MRPDRRRPDGYRIAAAADDRRTGIRGAVLCRYREFDGYGDTDGHGDTDTYADNHAHAHAHADAHPHA